MSKSEYKVRWTRVEWIKDERGLEGEAEEPDKGQGARARGGNWYGGESKKRPTDHFPALYILVPCGPQRAASLMA